MIFSFLTVLAVLKSQIVLESVLQIQLASASWIAIFLYASLNMRLRLTVYGRFEYDMSRLNVSTICKEERIFKAM